MHGIQTGQSGSLVPLSPGEVGRHFSETGHEWTGTAVPIRITLIAVALHSASSVASARLPSQPCACLLIPTRPKPLARVKCAARRDAFVGDSRARSRPAACGFGLKRGAPPLEALGRSLPESSLGDRSLTTV